MLFPFSDLSATKPRPAVVLAVLDRGDLIACQITSQANVRPEQVRLDPVSFVRGSLPVIG
jgi:mRNA interferase MazF